MISPLRPEKYVGSTFVRLSISSLSVSRGSFGTSRGEEKDGVTAVVQATESPSEDAGKTIIAKEFSALYCMELAWEEVCFSLVFQVVIFGSDLDLSTLDLSVINQSVCNLRNLTINNAS